MNINPEVVEILKEFNINRDAGLLCLLGIYHELDVDTIVPEDIIKAINVTKIVDRDYDSKTIVWNIALFEGQEVAFGWVKDWMEAFKRMNPDRVGSYRDAVPRMKAFFAKYPEYRKDDVYKARDAYIATVKESKFLMKSHKFIFDGQGAMKKSTLLEFCEKVATVGNTSNQRGKVIS